jgi:hypothetical protein
MTEKGFMNIPLLRIFALTLAQRNGDGKQLAKDIEKRLLAPDSLRDPVSQEALLALGFALLPPHVQDTLGAINGARGERLTLPQVATLLNIKTDSVRNRLEDGIFFLQMCSRCTREEVISYLRAKWARCRPQDQAGN